MNDGLRSDIPERALSFAILPVVLLQTTTTSAGVGPEELVDYGPTLIRAGWFVAGFLAVVLLGWYVLGPLFMRVVRSRNTNNPTLREALSRYYRIVVLVVAVYVGAGAAGYGLFLTNSALVISAVTLAIGVAGQQVIGSVISGLALVNDPEFSVGSYIEWEDGEGTVQSITLRVTRVLTLDGELVTIPNTTLTSQTIVRPFGRGRYRVGEQVGLDYDEDIDEAIAQLEAAAVAHDSILDQPDPKAYVEELGEDVVVIGVYYWIEDPAKRDIPRIRSEYARAIKTRLEESEIDISQATKLDLEGRIEVDESA